MLRLLPPFRLQQLAKRLTDQYPDPPRPVSLLDILGVYGPMLAYSGAIFVIVLVALSLLGGARSGTANEPLLVGIVVVGFALLGGGILFSVRGGLQRGVYATGEVVSRSRLHVTLRGQDIEVDLRSRSSYQPGQRMDVMMDPDKKTVLLVLGPSTT